MDIKKRNAREQRAYEHAIIQGTVLMLTCLALLLTCLS
jgi:hypothetical protein